MLNIDIENILNKKQKATKNTYINQEKRQKLVNWLKNNRLPLELQTLKNELDEELICINIMSTVLIKPPYGIDNCESKNEFILEKVRKLVLKVQY